jgi:DNA-binding beta-propeller fold protein YncE
MDARALGRCAGGLLAAVVVGSTSFEARDRSSLITKYQLQPGQIVTIAGGGPLTPSKPKRVALLGLSGLEVDPRDGTVYVVDSSRQMIVRINAKGTRLEPFAGAGRAGFNGDGHPALETLMNVPGDIAVHPVTGDVYVADTHNYRVRRISRDGTEVVTVAGVGIRGVDLNRVATQFPLVGPSGGPPPTVFSGDGGPATEAELNQPMGVAVDRNGVVFIADSANHRVRAVNSSADTREIAGVTIAPGAIATIAGSGVPGFSGDGGPARSARFNTPRKLRLAPDGTILVLDMLNSRIRTIDRASGVINTMIVGTPWKNEMFNGVDWSIDGMAVGPRGEVIYSDVKRSAVFRVVAPGRAQLVAGVGLQGRSSKGAVAVRAQLYGPGPVGVSPAGEVYIADVANQVVWKVASRKLKVFAGGGPVGDGKPATSATFSVLASLATLPEGDLIVPDMFLHRVRRIRADTGKIENYAGSKEGGYLGDGGPPKRARFMSPIRTSTDGPTVYVADPAVPAVRRITRGPRGEHIETIIGKPFTEDFTVVDKMPARLAQLGMPQEYVRNPITNEFFLCDSWLSMIRKLGPDGLLTTVAGTGKQGYAGDGGDARNAEFNWTVSLAFDAKGNLYVADMFNHRIRMIAPDGIVRTFAGTGEDGFGGDGGPAAAAKLSYPNSLAFDSAGNLYVADQGNHRIRRIELTAPYRITTAAGTGERGFSGDKGPAVEAQLNQPRGVAIDANDTLYIADSLNGRIRAVRLR